MARRVEAGGVALSTVVPRRRAGPVKMGFAFACRFYPIVDVVGVSGRSHVEIARAVCAAGPPLLQLRVKGMPTRDFLEVARAVKAVTDASGVRLIVNDRADIARLVDAAGVHLGQDDLPPAAARVLLGPGKIVGFSTHTRAQAEAAGRLGAADYIGFGPIFATHSKLDPDPVQGLDGLRAVRATVGLPIVAIGGITPASLPDVLTAGADAVAMIGAVVGAADITATVRELLVAAR